jgi:hypothetical protein
MAVAVGCGVLLGEGVVEGIWVALGMALVAAGVSPTVRVAVFSPTVLQPDMIKNKNSPMAIPANTPNLSLQLPVNRFISNGNDQNCYYNPLNTES